MDKYTSPIPQVVHYKITDNNGNMTPVMMQWMTQLVTYLQKNVGQEGFLLPRLTTAEINSLTNAVNGTMVYDITTDSPKMKRSGGWETITTTP